MLTTTRFAFAVGVFIGLAVGIPAGAIVVDVASATPLPACQFEDGNPDGTACTWTDPDTGRQFHVEAHPYGEPACRDICLGA